MTWWQAVILVLVAGVALVGCAAEDRGGFRELALGPMPSSSVEFGPARSAEPEVWREILAELRREPGYMAEFLAVDNWYQQLASLRDLPLERQVLGVAVLVNRSLGWRPRHRTNRLTGAQTRYQPDKKGLDQFRPPVVTRQMRGGDCEDLALVAMGGLHALGIPLEQMFLVKVRAPFEPGVHWVLEVRATDGRIWSIDAIEPWVSSGIHQRYRPMARLGVEGMTTIIYQPDEAA